MKIYTVALPEEFDELANEISRISVEKEQSISKTIRDILCDHTGFTPVTDVKKRNMYCEVSKSKVRRVNKKV